MAEIDDRAKEVADEIVKAIDRVWREGKRERIISGSNQFPWPSQDVHRVLAKVYADEIRAEARKMVLDGAHALVCNLLKLES